MSYAIGAQVPLQIKVTDATGAAISATSAAITISLPDNTTIVLSTGAATLTQAPTGTYTGYYTTTQVGWHSWVGSSVGPATESLPDSFTVVATTAAPLVSLAEIKANIGGSATLSDASLLRLALVATEICESSKGTGKVWRRLTRVEKFDGRGQPAILLQRRPVLSITTITESNITLVTTDYTLDSEYGILYRGPIQASGLWWVPGQQNIVVTYVAGTAGQVPEAVRQGVLELCSHLYDTQRGGSSIPRGAMPDWDARMAYTIPKRVLEAWAPYKAASV